RLSAIFARYTGPRQLGAVPRIVKPFFVTLATYVAVSGEVSDAVTVTKFSRSRLRSVRSAFSSYSSFGARGDHHTFCGTSAMIRCAFAAVSSSFPHVSCKTVVSARGNQTCRVTLRNILEGMTEKAMTIPHVVVDRLVRGRVAADMLLVIGASALIALAAQ